MKNIVVLLSGGVDSSTLIAYAHEIYGVPYKDILGLIVHYGQRHDKEIRAANLIADYYKIARCDVDLSGIFRDFDNPMLQHSTQEVPAKTYAEQLEQGGSVPTYVPFRNGIFLSTAAAHALNAGAEYILYGAHADDAAGSAYPDCTPEFVKSMNLAICNGTGHKVGLIAPFVSCTKADIVRRGLEFGVPYHLTWSCYKGEEKPCGVCGTCRDRLAAFEANNAKDPLVY